MKREVETPADYLEALDGESLALVERIRDVIRVVAPEIDEGIRYGMLDYPGLANLGAQKRYVALYVAPEVLARHRDRFVGVDAGKSCLRFARLDQAEPLAIETLLRDVRSHREAQGA